MNAGWPIVRAKRRLVKVEGIFIERRRPDWDIGRQCVHYELVCSYNVRSLFSMRHSECAPAQGVPLV